MGERERGEVRGEGGREGERERRKEREGRNGRKSRTEGRKKIVPLFPPVRTSCRSASLHSALKLGDCSSISDCICATSETRGRVLNSVVMIRKK